MFKFSFFPTQASTGAKEVDALFLFITAVSLLFATAIAVTIVFFAIRYRRRSPDEVPRPIHGSTALELTWSVIPFVIAMVIFFWSASVFLHLSRPPDDALEVFVVGKQWMWKLQHMEGRREINELHVPIGRPIKLTMTSEDVIHSFYVPAFRIKADAVPGRYTTTWFEPTKVGTYHIFCAEYCGTAHSGMIGWVVVMEQADYQQWLAGDGGAAPAGADMAAADSGAAAAAPSAGAEPDTASIVAAGEALFNQKGCVTCHQSAPGALGPPLAGVYGKSREFESGETVTADDAYLRDSILNPRAKIVKGYLPVMPTFEGQLSEEQILQLIQYIRSLSPPGDTAAAPPENAPPSGPGQDS
jgi:cytochrome c oxidase subunit 2